MIKYRKGPSLHYTWHEVNPHGFSGMGVSVRANAIKHARNMERLRVAVNAARKKHGLKATGIHILSWWRPEWYNHQIGGATRSQHIKGDATDISVQEIDRLFPWWGGRHDFDTICNRLFSHGGFGQYPAGSRHTDSRGWRSRWTSW